MAECARHRFPPETISHAVTPLSIRAERARGGCHLSWPCAATTTRVGAGLRSQQMAVGAAGKRRLAWQANQT